MSEPPRPDSIEALFARFGPGYRWLVTATVMMGMISTILSATTINVALPDIMGAFGIGQDRAQLLSTGFLAAMTGAMLLNAWMVGACGQRMTFILAVAVFIAASVMGGLAHTEGMLILSRVLQGAAAGILQPLAMQIIFQVFPPEKRGSAMGLYGFGVVLAPALGPAVGGIIIDGFSWRYVFFMTIPFSAIGLFLAMIFMPGRSASATPGRFDWLGFCLLTLFLVTLLSGLSNGQRHGWMSNTILRYLTVALVAGGGFALWELYTSTPLLNLKLFGDRTFVSASVVAFIFGAGIFASTFLVPLFVQTIQGYTPTRSGLLLMPAGLVLAFVFMIAGRLTDTMPARSTLMFGLLLFAISSWLMADADTNTPFWLFAWWIIVGRIGLGFIMPSVNVAAMRALPPALLSQGAGAINFVRQLGGALGVNLISIFLEWRSQLYVHAFTASQDAANTTTTHLLHGVADLYARAGVPEAVRPAAALDYLGRMIYAQGSMMGFRDCFLVLAVISFCALLPAFLMRPSLQATHENGATPVLNPGK